MVNKYPINEKIHTPEKETQDKSSLLKLYCIAPYDCYGANSWFNGFCSKGCNANSYVYSEELSFYKEKFINRIKNDFDKNSQINKMGE